MLSEDSVCHLAEKQKVNVLNQWTYHARLYRAAAFAARNSDVELVYPVHLSPVVRDAVDKYLRGAPRVHLIDPLPADEMHNLMARCYMVMTDSGGLQEDPTI